MRQQFRFLKRNLSPVKERHASDDNGPGHRGDDGNGRFQWPRKPTNDVSNGSIRRIGGKGEEVNIPKNFSPAAAAALSRRREPRPSSPKHGILRRPFARFRALRNKGNDAPNEHEDPADISVSSMSTRSVQRDAWLGKQIEKDVKAQHGFSVDEVIGIKPDDTWSCSSKESSKTQSSHSGNTSPSNSNTEVRGNTSSHRSKVKPKTVYMRDLIARSDDMSISDLMEKLHGTGDSPGMHNPVFDRFSLEDNRNDTVRFRAPTNGITPVVTPSVHDPSIVTAHAIQPIFKVEEEEISFSSCMTTKPYFPELPSMDSLADHARSLASLFNENILFGEKEQFFFEVEEAQKYAFGLVSGSTKTEAKTDKEAESFIYHQPIETILLPAPDAVASAAEASKLEVKAKQAEPSESISNKGTQVNEEDTGSKQDEEEKSECTPERSQSEDQSSKEKASEVVDSHASKISLSWQLFDIPEELQEEEEENSLLEKDDEFPRGFGKSSRTEYPDTVVTGFSDEEKTHLSDLTSLDHTVSPGTVLVDLWARNKGLATEMGQSMQEAVNDLLVFGGVISEAAADALFSGDLASRDTARCIEAARCASFGEMVEETGADIEDMVFMAAKEIDLMFPPEGTSQKEWLKKMSSGGRDTSLPLVRSRAMNPRGIGGRPHIPSDMSQHSLTLSERSSGVSLTDKSGSGYKADPSKSSEDSTTDSDDSTTDSDDDSEDRETNNEKNDENVMRTANNSMARLERNQTCAAQTDLGKTNTPSTSESTSVLVSPDTINNSGSHQKSDVVKADLTKCSTIGAPPVVGSNKTEPKLPEEEESYLELTDCSATSAGESGKVGPLKCSTEFVKVSSKGHEVSSNVTKTYKSVHAQEEKKRDKVLVPKQPSQEEAMEATSPLTQNFPERVGAPSALIQKILEGGTMFGPPAEIKCLADSVTDGGTRQSHSTITGITGVFEQDESVAWSRVLDSKEDETVFQQVQREGLKAKKDLAEWLSLSVMFCHAI